MMVGGLAVTEIANPVAVAWEWAGDGTTHLLVWPIYGSGRLYYGARPDGGAWVTMRADERWTNAAGTIAGARELVREFLAPLATTEG